MYFSIVDLNIENWFSVLLALIPAILNLGVIAHIVLRLPRNLLTRTFSLFVFALVLWQFDDVFARLCSTQEGMRTNDMLLSVGWIFLGPMSMYFTLQYTERRSIANSPLILFTIFAPAVFFNRAYHSGIIPAIYERRKFWGWINNHDHSLLDSLMIFWIAVLVLTSMVLLIHNAWKTRKHEDHTLRFQTLLVAVGMTIPSVQGIITQVLLPLGFGIAAIPVTSTFLSFFAIATAIALDRYKLFSVSDSINPQALLDNLSDIVIALSGHGEVIYLNSSGKKHLGTIINGRKTRYENLVAGNALEKKKFDEEVIRKTLNKKRVENYECRLLSVTGEEIPVIITADFLHVHEKDSGILLVARNVSDLRKLAESMTQNERHFKAIIEGSQDGVVMLNEDGIITYATPSNINVLGFTPAELVGKSIAEFVHPEHLATVASNFKEISDGKRNNIKNEVLCRHKHGHWVWVEGMGNNMLKDPYVRGIVANFRDITETKKAQENILKKNLELSKINSELDHIIYSASHNIRAPLMSILGLINIAKQEKDPAVLNQYYDMISSSVHKLDDFTKDIIHYSRNQRTEIKNEAISFKELLQDVIEDVNLLRESDDIIIKHKVSEEERLLSDKYRVRQLLTNLISNAVKYHDEAKHRRFVNIKINVNKSAAEIIVEDNGVGIHPEHQDKVFHMFYRANDRSVGAGLGLYIAKDIVEKLGGNIKMESEPGKGSKFKVKIPSNSIA